MSAAGAEAGAGAKSRRTKGAGGGRTDPIRAGSGGRAGRPGPRVGSPFQAGGMPPLRPYQREAARAVLRAVAMPDGGSISIEIARQGGKNELSAQLEVMLLARHLGSRSHRGQMRPDLAAAGARSASRACGSACARPAWRRGHGAMMATSSAWGARASCSSRPSQHSNVVGHTADLLLEVDEAQDVDVDKFDKELRPMAASTAAPTVLLRHGLGRRLPAGASQADAPGGRAPRRPPAPLRVRLAGRGRCSMPALRRASSSAERERVWARPTRSS